MRIQLRIVAGSLRGRKLSCQVNDKLRPAPEMLREALFNILRDAVPGRTFYDLFAGTGAVGLEAVSRDAVRAVMVERDHRTAEAIEQHARLFGVADRVAVVRADAYRWAERWRGDREPVNVFLGPPYPDFEDRLDDLMQLVGTLQRKVAPGSVLVLQSEKNVPAEELPAAEQWERRAYGRNLLLIWVKEPVEAAAETAGE
jgi:16S rRNA (guanine(966)-N(2))-methyltransferase RsmD